MPELSAVHLRRGVPADYDTVAEIWHSSASLPGVGPATMPTLPQLRERVPREVEEGWEITIAESAGRIVAFMATRPREATLAELFVRPDALGGGIGRLLLAEAQVAMPGGFTLFTRASNAGARRFYERAGMVVVREAIHPKYGDPIVYYGWNIGPNTPG